jgi:type 1 fimbria pilin
MQFYKLNSYLQVAVELWIDGQVEQYVPVPFTNYSNRDTQRNPCPSSGIEKYKFRSGSRGRLHLMIDRPFIGESSIPRTNLVEMIAAIETPNPGTTPISSVWMSGSVVVPQSCSLAKGQMLTIDLGAVSYSDLTHIGNTPERTESRTFYVECENISESVGVNISLVGPVHPTQRNALAIPDRNDMAIILKNNGRIVPPVETDATSPETTIPLNFNQQAQRGEFDLEAYPVRVTDEVKYGPYRSSVSVKFDFE